MELLSESNRLNEEEKGGKKGYSVIDLFRSMVIAKITLLLIVDWYMYVKRLAHVYSFHEIPNFDQLDRSACRITPMLQLQKLRARLAP